MVALKNAVRNSDKELVVNPLDQGVDPNQFRSSGYEDSSPLMVAKYLEYFLSIANALVNHRVSGLLKQH